MILSRGDGEAWMLGLIVLNGGASAFSRNASMVFA